jgi:hypothetical protein
VERTIAINHVKLKYLTEVLATSSKGTSALQEEDFTHEVSEE